MQSTSHHQMLTIMGTVNNAFYGSFLPIPSADVFPAAPEPADTLLGALICRKEPIKINASRRRFKLEVKNAGDRPIQVGSHYHFLETNPALIFDRLLSYGYHLDIPAGTAVRFEPGEKKTVTMVEFGGKKIFHGGSGLASGSFDENLRETKVKEMVEKGGFGHKDQEKVEEGPTTEMNREVVCLM